jgi:hypothetical protein
VTTAEQLHQEQAILGNTLEAAVEQLITELADWSRLSPQAAAAEARNLMPELVAQFGDEAALAGADFYDTLRAEVVTGAAASYAAKLAPATPVSVVQDELDWALAPIFPAAGDTQTFDLEHALGAALGRMGNVLQLLVGDQQRDTIAVSAADDPVGTRYARHASANACAFCRLMATRGATYRSEESALVVVGEVDPRDIAQRIRGPRGPRKEGEKYHDNCRCIAVPVFPGDTLTEAPYVAQWRLDYADAAAAAGGSTRADLKAILAHMRETTGAR